jgi:hypothetical protein
MLSSLCVDLTASFAVACRAKHTTRGRSMGMAPGGRASPLMIRFVQPADGKAFPVEEAKSYGTGRRKSKMAGNVREGRESVPAAAGFAV